MVGVYVENAKTRAGNPAKVGGSSRTVGSPTLVTVETIPQGLGYVVSKAGDVKAVFACCALAIREADKFQDPRAGALTELGGILPWSKLHLDTLPLLPLLPLQSFRGPKSSRNCFTLSRNVSRSKSDCSLSSRSADLDGGLGAWKLFIQIMRYESPRR